MKLRHDVMGLLLAVGLGLAAVNAETYQGASAILSALDAIEKQEKSKDEPSNKPAVVVAFEELRANVGKLSDEEAAKAWISAYEVLLSLTREDSQSFNQPEWRESLQLNMKLSLPKSSVWKIIKEEVQKRAKADPKEKQALALRYFMAVLTTDLAEKAACEEALLVVIQQNKEIPAQYKDHFKQEFERSTERLMEHTSDAKYQLENFEKNLKKSLNSDPKDEESRYRTLEVPNLVQLVGEERTKGLLKEVFKVKGEVDIRGVKELKLAKELFLKSPDSLAVPRWAWISDLNDAALYEAMEKRFGKETEDENQIRGKNDAQQIYVASLVVRGKKDEAMALVRAKVEAKEHFAVPSHILEALKNQGFGKQVYDFYLALVTEWPQLDLWHPLIESASWQQKTPEVVALLKTNLAKLEVKQQQALRPILYKALLANNEVEEGVKVLRDLLANPEPFFAKIGEEGNNEGNVLAVSEIDYLPHAKLMVNLGVLLKREEWKKEGLEALQKGLTQPNKDSVGDSWATREALPLLVTYGHGVWVENFVKQRLEKQLEKAKKERGGGANLFGYDAKSWLTTLMGIYHHAGRYEEVLTLLDESKYWGEDTLEKVNDSYGSWSTQELAVHAMLKVGRKRDAEAIVLKQLRGGESEDRWFEWLLHLKGQEALPILDEAYSRNAFEERPLIWKAKLLLEAGKLAEAESTVKAAIAIDPSDGETGKNDRMRVYQVLGEISQKKGEVEQAKTMEGVIAAIRLSENADDFWSAGLLSQAVGMYEQSLRHFADAYCIQSRLALRYREMNMPEKAEVHYRRAFELMPDSFGRIESHCFGCEGAFKGDQAQKIAEEVFEKLALEQPNKAQVFYLLGYLRESQNRNEEAAAAYRRAIKLDPQYLNAFKKLVGLKESIGMSLEEEEDLAARWFALDPYDHNGGFQAFRSIKSTAKAWDLALVEQARHEDQIPSPAYVLKATLAFKEEQLKSAGEQARYMRNRKELSPRDTFLDEAQGRLQAVSLAHDALRTAMQLTMSR